MSVGVCSVKITNTVSKASAGVAEFFPVHQVKDPVRLASSLTHAGWEVVSSASLGGGDNTITNPIDVTTFKPKGNILLIVGQWFVVVLIVKEVSLPLPSARFQISFLIPHKVNLFFYFCLKMPVLSMACLFEF